MKKVLMLSLGLLVGLGSIQTTKGFVSLFVRLAVAYTSYKFVDGVVEGSISSFVNDYIDGPIDFAYSYGEGVKTFGTGVRTVVIGFTNDTSKQAFAHAWQELKNQFDFAVIAGKSEWARRRLLTLQTKKKQTTLQTTNQPIQENNNDVGSENNSEGVERYS